MLTKIDLCSLALLKLGEQPVQSLTDNSAAAQMARTLFDPVMSTLLSLYPWRFATREITLQKNTDGDFVVPSDVLRIIRTDGEVVGNKIIVKNCGDQITVRAIVRTAPEDFPGYFASLAATKLAMEFCIPLTGNQGLFSMTVAMYESELRSAKFIDGTTSVNGGIGDFSLISARF